MPIMLPGCDLLLRDRQTPIAVALGQHRRDDGATRRPLVERHEARNGLAAACNDELFTGLDASEELGQMRLWGIPIYVRPNASGTPLSCYSAWFL